MIRALLQLWHNSGGVERRQLLGFAACGLAAFGLGFLAVDPIQAEHLIVKGGYYYILGVFVLFLVFARRVLTPRRAVWREWLRHPGWPGVGIALAAACTIWIDPVKHKILYDEYVLQGTAFHMHATKEIGTVMRAYEIAGSWVSIDTFLDKRPYFFTFLVSLVHDLTGYRIANIFAVNIALAPVFIALVYWLAVQFTGRRGPAGLAIALLATMPLLGQQVTGAGMELHNITMIAAVMALSVLYLNAPDSDRLSLLVLGAVLLSQSRYESVIFVVPTALVVVAGWLKIRRVLLSWPALVAPLLLVPYAWHNRVLSAKPVLWQLRAGETARFSITYLRGNLEGAWRFFFNTGVELANSWWLSVAGVVALVWLIGVGFRRWREGRLWPLGKPALVVTLFGAAVAGNFVMLMFYYWSRLDEVIASRFALPVYFILALLAAWFAADLDARRWRGTRWLAAGLAAWVFVCALPAISRRPYTDQNLVMLEVDWTHDLLAARKGPVLLLTNASTIPFVLMRIPTILIGAARVRSEQIRYHLEAGTFREVVVVQAIRPLSADGTSGVDPDDVIPKNFHLETLAEKRFGGRWLRVSRVVAIDPPAPVSAAVPAARAPLAGLAR